MCKIDDIYKWLCAFAPLELQMSFDNSGFLVGRKDREVDRVLIALDITPELVLEAQERGAQLIISHHPVIFSAIKSLTDEKLLQLAKADIAAICMHTNLDICDGGVNDVLIELLSGSKAASPLGEDGCGRVAYLPEEMNLESFLENCKSVLGAEGLRYYDAHRKVSKLAVLGGSGADYMMAAVARGCDSFVTADIKHHEFLLAAELGINLIDAGHYCTEAPVIPALKTKLSAAFEDVEFILSSRQGQIIHFI